MAQVVMIEFMHERDQLAQFAGRKTLAGEPAKVMAGQVGDHAALVFSIRHCAGQEKTQVIGVHEKLSFEVWHRAEGVS